MTRILTSLFVALALAGCRTDDYLLLSEETDIDGSKSGAADYRGLYILCQGNMGSNKCQLDCLEFAAASKSSDGATAEGGSAKIKYFSNIYAERNPDAVKELGDVGNDIKVYGSKLWMTINCSNKVEVCRASDTRKLAQIDIANCRYLAFHKGFAYVSSYVGPVKVHGDAPIGKVYKVDTLTLKIAQEVEVGYQPDEMAVVGDRLYVANSGGYRIPDYDTRLTEIDLNTFSVVRHIDIAPNLYRCRADKYGQLWVTSRGDYFGGEPDLFCIPDPAAEKPQVIPIGTPCSALEIVGDTLYYIGSSFNYTTMRTEQCIGAVDVCKREKLQSTLFDAKEIQRIESLYGIIVNPRSKDFYLLDAKNHVSSGELLHFNPDGSFDYRVWTGDIPCAGAFY